MKTQQGIRHRIGVTLHILLTPNLTELARQLYLFVGEIWFEPSDKILRWLCVPKVHEA